MSARAARTAAGTSCSCSPHAARAAKAPFWITTSRRSVHSGTQTVSSAGCALWGRDLGDESIAGVELGTQGGRIIPGRVLLTARLRSWVGLWESQERDYLAQKVGRGGGWLAADPSCHGGPSPGMLRALLSRQLFRA